MIYVCMYVYVCIHTSETYNNMDETSKNHFAEPKTLDTIYLWFCLYKIQEQAKLLSGDRNQIVAEAWIKGTWGYF